MDHPLLVVNIPLCCFIYKNEEEKKESIAELVMKQAFFILQFLYSNNNCYRRISHWTHHQNHGHVEKDESWHPLPENIYQKLDGATKMLRFSLPFPMFAYLLYLWSRSPGKKDSHSDPSSDLFTPNKRKDVMTSTVCWTAMVVLLDEFLWKLTMSSSCYLWYNIDCKLKRNVLEAKAVG